jgi:hypothetical protein
MKKIILSTFSIVALSLSSFGQTCNLFFSEYLEGSSNNKAIEIYNPLTTAVNLGDYKIFRYNNGSPTPTDSLQLVGTLAPGAVYVAGNPSAVPAMTAVSDTLHTITFFNGDDAMELRYMPTNTSLDVIGIIGNDPGVNWVVGTGATSEFTLVRKFVHLNGETNWAIGATEWDVYPQNTETFLGSHSGAPCCLNTTASVAATSCVSYTWAQNGMNYTSSGNYNDTIANVAGCDSIITLNLTILDAAVGSQTMTVCAGDSVTVGTITHNTTGVFTDVLTAANGCDSTVTTNLTVSAAIVGSQSITVCAGGSVTVGTVTHTTTGVFIDVLTATNGCDSTVTTNLTVDPVIDVTITNASPVLTANQTGATYQWLDCNNSNQAIAGETNQNYTATVSGSYAVEITVGNCVDTSVCETVTVTSIHSVSENVFAVYPNPSSGVFTMNLVSVSKVEITNTLGQFVYEKQLNSGKQEIDLTNVVEGVYFVKVISGKQQGVKRIVISK